MSALAQPPPICLCGHTINYKKSEVLCIKNVDVRIVRIPPPPLSKKCLHWTNLPSLWLQTFFYGQLQSLWKSCESGNYKWQVSIIRIQQRAIDMDPAISESLLISSLLHPSFIKDLNFDTMVSFTIANCS